MATNTRLVSTREGIVLKQQRSALRERLIAGYQARAGRDQALAEEWRPLEEEA